MSSSANKIGLQDELKVKGFSDYDGIAEGLSFRLEEADAKREMSENLVEGVDAGQIDKAAAARDHGVHMTQPVINFNPYQRAWISDTSRFKIAMMSRQVGKTFTTCGECVDDCIQGELDGQRKRWVILSRGEHQASEAMVKAIKPMTQAFYGAYNTLLKGGDPTYVETEFRAPQN